MNEREKAVVENLAKACTLLPENKKEYLLGFAEGVAAVAGNEILHPTSRESDMNKPSSRQ